MCGIVGLFYGRSVDACFAAAVARMGAEIHHRGPDAKGVWEDASIGMALGHQRLSIVDLSSAGAQPMHSACGRYVMVFNGEIYNHTSLRKALKASSDVGLKWRGRSDTETFLSAVAAWGLRSALLEAEGMFALAVWDRQKQTLTLARDRFGEKPLYYGVVAGALTFASELKAFQCAPGWRGVVNTGVVEDYLRFGCVGGARSIFKGVYKLEPGHLLRVDASDLRSGSLPRTTSWWSAVNAAQAGVAEEVADASLALNNVETALSDSVLRRMEADVPIGAFLSGGVDSSLIAALMQKHAGQKVRTFSVGFDDPRYDESAHAAAVAGHIGTNHTTLRATSKMALDLVPALSDLYDEPFADSSQLPTTLVSALTQKHVTVALSGDGGDELFGGYNRYIWCPKIWRQLKVLPLPMRRALGGVLKRVPAVGYDRLMAGASSVMPSRYHIRTFGEKLHKLADVLSASSEQSLYLGVASMNRNPQSVIAPAYRSAVSSDGLYSALNQFGHVEWMMLMDTLNYMVDDVLVKVDRASMSSSLEVRVPFLDTSVFHAAWQLPAELRTRGGETKWALRQVLYRHVPQELIERPKMGFSIPLDSWLRGPLRDWAEDLLTPSALVDIPVLDAKAISQMWRLHLQGRGHYAQQLWTIIQLSAWVRRWRPLFP